MAAAQWHKDELGRALQASSDEKAEIRSSFQADIAALEEKLSAMNQQLQAMGERLLQSAASAAAIEPLKQRVTELETELVDSALNLKIAERRFLPKLSPALPLCAPADHESLEPIVQHESALCTTDSASSSALISSESVRSMRRRQPSLPRHCKGKRISSFGSIASTSRFASLGSPSPDCAVQHVATYLQRYMLTLIAAASLSYLSDVYSSVPPAT